MRVISVWQPFATLLVRGFKIFETRGWPAPQSVIGQRIGIASTKSIQGEQRTAMNDEDFAAHYQKLNLPPLENLPHGFLLGTAVLQAVVPMSEEFMEEVSDEEKAYGWWTPDRFAWRMVDPIALEIPIVIKGAQGIFQWNGVLPDAGAEVETSSPD